MKLQDKVALITGGAAGIGKVTAQKFVDEGAKVIICDVEEETLSETRNALSASGGSIEAKVTDVTNKTQVDQLIDQIVNDYGKLDVVVNNAGVTADATLTKMAEEQFDKVINVNLKGVFLVGQKAAKIMKKQEQGVILNASSVVGLYGNFGQTNYAATKWGVIGMTKTWAKELGKNNVRVNAVAPGFIETEMVSEMPEKVVNMMQEKSPLNRLGSPEEVANIYCFLASDDSSFVTGSVYGVDGGVVL
ncbi:3-oxoacyl-ACP reductase FabG [Natranaerobius thermophilus]|uniref:3-oxoacyl-[acyl-carrier-protein] reductase n=1 Tax=Natranaerobius thermophilus (strain ATCC BAA-1301 / DSM 18059 / JW/NM-WN-LF) TaxID=457570 RepID=B2A2S5_NATTJ|nr:3-oxoacyl-ACP reductase FabG [Natranaerobius thermophilus]ACB86293.1 3-oxoacyl-(acyl-carrier-protein) reductase [Natranaerobius thermophilus JW/NM-WN-LF]